MKPARSVYVAVGRLESLRDPSSLEHLHELPAVRSLSRSTLEVIQELG